MNSTHLKRLASELERLAGRLEEYARRAKKPAHLATNICQLAIQAGRLQEKAGRAGAFEGAGWWRDGKSPVDPFDDGQGNSTRYDSDADFFSHLWIQSIGSWLTKRLPERFRHNAADWGWAHIARDEEGRLLGKDGKPLRVLRFRDGEPLPDDFRRTPDSPPGVYESRLDGEIAEIEDFYDEADWMEHLRIRAEVHSDACRVLAELIKEHQKPMESGDLNEYLRCSGLERFVVKFVSRFPDIYRDHRPWNLQERCLLELLDDANENACPTTPEEIGSVVANCLEKGWIEWSTTDDGEHILRRTDLGNLACGQGTGGADTFPAPTITDVEEAIRPILQILASAKHDPGRRYRGDPRVEDREVMDSDLYSWARHMGVSKDAYLEAESECLGRGLITSTPCYGGASCRITSAGTEFVRSACSDDASAGASIPARAQRAGNQYEQAVEALGTSSPTDREVYDQLASAMATPGETSDLPTFATWSRNLRTYRKCTGQQKNTARTGRTEGMVRTDQIESSHLPTRVRREKTRE